ncbi:phosphatidylinositol 3 [Colletotrichum lupini]|uniref:Serine/threonine-protein kinase MEC1 n=2 Tax=Colletotrichum acutatum species complex TaxID=2707335 RepID=A0A9Q8SUB4_9PEZI|nr:phosphatidylinositol 3 [Colletotrichum lupini]UQC83200.1 phosphatidylinositol 3 [Colletotrichum lupini]
MNDLNVLWPYDEDGAMAANHNGRPAAAAAPNAPPPSTLAAQLVENISASSKSTRSDENAELKRLFAVIEKVKNKPELLETAEQRTGHNHMLIYVYARVVLEGIKLDDPFADRNHMRNEALKAINFLKVTIEETPNVLNHTTDGKQFVFRGEEPLWIWVFPKILRLLGHSRCLELTGDFEGFFQFVILVVIRTGSMWKLLPFMLLYLRETSRALISHLQNMAPSSTGKDASVNMTLPSDSTLELLLGKPGTLFVQQTTYTVQHVSQCIHQATTLTSALAHPSIFKTPSLVSRPTLSQMAPWLLDSLLSLRAVQNAWQAIVPRPRADLLKIALNLLSNKPRPGKKFFDLKKPYAVLAVLCAELAAHPEEIQGTDDSSAAARKTVSLALIRLAHASLVDREIGRLTAPKIVCPLEYEIPSLATISDAHDFILSIQVLKQTSGSIVPKALDSETQPASFIDADLRQAVEELGLENRATEDAEPASKRLKVSSEAPELRALIKRIYEVCQVDEAEEAGGLEHNFLNKYNDLSENNQCRAIDLVARICCAVDLATVVDGGASIGNHNSIGCTFCDDKYRGSRTLDVTTAAEKREAQSIFTKLIHLPNFKESKRPRIVAMISARRIINHADVTELIDLETSPLGQWCLQSLHSSIRELRIASGRALPLFLRDNNLESLDPTLIIRNRKNALSLLKAASEKDAAIFHESGILAWGQLGRVVTGDELNLVLHKLLEYLGSINSLIASCAFNEILNLASALNTTPRRLFEPFWRNLAYFAVKDMQARPQICRAIADLLQISVTEFLLLIQSHALPWLVLMKKKEVIQKIAEARGERDIWVPILDPANAGSIIALLLIQDVGNIENFVMSRLVEVSSHLETFTLVELVQSEVCSVALELFKAAGEADEARKPRIIEALASFCSMMMVANKESKPKKGNTIGRYLQSYILGLMARLADVINDMPLVFPPAEEQRRCIRALEEMIRHCKAYVRIARPQIAACLLSSLAQDDLREAAFSCWAALLTCLEPEDVEALIETTFFVISHYWPLFSESSRQMAKTLIQKLITEFSDSLNDYITKLPSLGHITELADVEKELNAARPVLDSRTAFALFAERTSHENSGVVLLALTELEVYLRQSGGFLQTSAISQQPDPVVPMLIRALLDCAAKYSAMHQLEIASLCTQCIGLVGCLDSNRVEAPREQQSMVILSNFESADETTDFVLFILGQILVKAFLSTTDTKLQGFLSFAMQELLDRVDIKAALAMKGTGMRDGGVIYRKWLTLSESDRTVLTPFLTSRYLLTPMNVVPVEYPIFRPGKPYGNWMRSFSMDLLGKGQNGHADLIFEPLCRTIKVKDLAVAEFLLPYLVLHVIVGHRSTRKDRDNVIGELVGILQHQPAEDAPYSEREDMKLYCEAVFRALDYASRWLQEKDARRKNDDDLPAIGRVQELLNTIPPVLISQRAMDCREYPRALFHLEQHAQQMEVENSDPRQKTLLLEQLQDIYTQIDEPDGLEGISAHLHVLDINQQILSHKKAGRYTAAQTWYEIKLAEEPDNIDVQIDLLNCLKQSGQHDVLLNYVEGMRTEPSTENKIVPYAVEAAWATRRWDTLNKYTARFHGSPLEDFNVGIAKLFNALQRRGPGSDTFPEMLQSMREKIASAMTHVATSSLQACHDLRLRCHVLTDLEIIAGTQASEGDAHQEVLTTLNRRLEVLGAPKFSDLDISSLWLSSARLARKANSTHQSFNAVLHASQLGDGAAVIENARLLWKDGHTRKAIQVLQGAIESNNFMTQTNSSSSIRGMDAQQRQLTARAQLMLAKWLDAAGQTNHLTLREKYQQPPLTASTWEKGHYYLGRYYKKVLESEKTLKADDQTDPCIQGEYTRLVVENYLRSLNYGTKYLYQTMPRILTLWLEFGAQVDKAPEGKVSLSRELHRRRTDQLNLLHRFLDKSIARLPAYIFYTALPQKVDGSNYELRQLLRMGEKLAEQLLLACNNGDFQSNRTTVASITRDLNFNHKCTPCPLVVPIESCLTAALPTLTDNVKTHKAFSRDVITIDSFLDEVLVLGSLAKPRRLTARGTDGKSYMLMIKPKDDLRTDQRLMEFNSMINRSLKRDPEASRRQLYIKTYAVVPLNEECGIIEWVDGLKTLREILLDQYKSRQVHPDYNQIKRMMAEAVTGPNNIKMFTEGVLGTFPPVLQHWFVQRFPHPSTWFSARLKYTRSCAVMSMVGTILGLGDRHGENVLLERDNGGIFHVDFNCLFDKGLTFAQPEKVPFRLTHNMVAAMGIYGYEGPFRHCSELTLWILRQQEETLMTILEAFIYDPTLDLQKEKKTSRRQDGAPRMQPQLVVDSIKRKVKGLMGQDTIPLGVEGQVEELIKQAADPRNLAAMYIGWCPFFLRCFFPNLALTTSPPSHFFFFQTPPFILFTFFESTLFHIQSLFNPIVNMPDYRIEVSPNNRAGCTDGVCKKAAAKCLKGSLRFGTWTKIMDHESFKWKHWGCVSGEQMQHVRELCERNGKFDFDAFDGYDEMGDHPDLQAKIRSAIEQGHIDAEDFNGDPWMNKLGQRGIRGKKPKDWDDGEEEDEDEAPAKGKKRGRKAADEVEEEKPKAKRTKKAAAKAETEDEEEEKPKPKAKRGARKSAIKEEESDDGEPIAAPKLKRGPAKKAAAVKKEESDAEEAEEAPKPKRGAVKKAAPKKAAKKVKAEESEEEVSAAEPETNPESEEEEKPAPQKAKAAPKGRKKAAPAAEAEKPKSTRASRSRK